jgi:acetolactate synthase-1/2/3 large subunit
MMQPSTSLIISSSPSSSARRVSAAHAMLAYLADHGVSAAFGIPGGLISPLFDALAGVPAIRLLSTRHETMAGFAAMGHAVATGLPGLVLTTSGPGITNAITAIAAADAEEIPLIVVGGEVSTTATSRGGFQDASTNAIDIVAMLRTVTRWSVRLENAASASAVAARALRTAMGPRPGPVFVSVPIDVGNSTAPVASLRPSSPPPPIAPGLGACESMARALCQARRPLIVAGNGARSAADPLRELAEVLHCPVVCTAHGKGVFPDSHPLHLGIIGFGGHASARAYLEARPDVVLIVGSRLGDFATDGWSLPLVGSDATYQIDRDEGLLGRNYPLTLGVVADASVALRGILEALPADIAPPSSSRVRVRRPVPVVVQDDDAPLRPSTVLDAVQRAFPEAFWTSDIGEHCAHVVHDVIIDRPDRFRAMLGLASMGSGIGTAIGVRHARRDVPVVCVCGDGGFAMHAGDLLTCVQNGIDVVFVIFNDGRWNMVEHGFRAVYGKTPMGLPSAMADFAQIARGFGAIGVRADRASDLAPERLRELASLGRPVVIDARIDPSDALSVGTRSASVRRSAFGSAT